MPLPNNDDILRAIPLRFRAVQMPTPEVVDAAAHHMTMMQLEKAFCTGDRKGFMEMSREIMAKVAEQEAQAGNTEPLQRLNTVSISEKQLTDLMLSYLEGDEEGAK